MSRLRTESPQTCVTCKGRIAGHAVFHIGLPFCCAGCAADGPCTCSYDDDAPDDGQGRRLSGPRQTTSG